MINSKLYWKELTSDGLLKEPKDLGPYYSTDSINQYDGFDTEDEAIKRLNKMVEIHKWDIPPKLILIRVYSR